MCLVIGVGGFSILHGAVERSNGHFAPPDPVTKMLMAGFFPAMAVTSFLVILWGDGCRVVDFICDGQEFRFRKLNGRWETRRLRETAEVRELYGRCQDLRGYRVRFRDGTEVFLSPQLPHAAELAERLHGRI